MQPCIGVLFQEFAILYPSLDYLTAFALAFAGGALCSTCLHKHADGVLKASTGTARVRQASKKFLGISTCPFQ
ncbi:hypothetical protein WK24_15580 [Burkholderia vietnamiensis]|nr:hypothetical protein WK24_15580 [Burkholderia vietnamiensis]